MLTSCRWPVRLKIGIAGIPGRGGTSPRALERLGEPGGGFCISTSLVTESRNLRSSAVVESASRDSLPSPFSFSVVLWSSSFWVSRTFSRFVSSSISSWTRPLSGVVSLTLGLLPPLGDLLGQIPLGGVRSRLPSGDTRTALVWSSARAFAGCSFVPVVVARLSPSAWLGLATEASGAEGTTGYRGDSFSPISAC